VIVETKSLVSLMQLKASVTTTAFAFTIAIRVTTKAFQFPPSPTLEAQAKLFTLHDFLILCEKNELTG
jgi:hypothetical protein